MVGRPGVIRWHEFPLFKFRKTRSRLFAVSFSHCLAQPVRLGENITRAFSIRLDAKGIFPVGLLAKASFIEVFCFQPVAHRLKIVFWSMPFELAQVVKDRHVESQRGKLAEK